MTTSTDIDRQAAAELAVLLEHDVRRQIAGFDYGCGQRRKEIITRERAISHETFMRGYALQAVVNGYTREGVELDAETRVELHQAVERLMRPRLRRLRQQMERMGYGDQRTTARRKAEEAIIQTLRRFGSWQA